MSVPHLVQIVNQDGINHQQNNVHVNSVRLDGLHRVVVQMSVKNVQLVNLVIVVVCKSVWIVHKVDIKTKLAQIFVIYVLDNNIKMKLDKYRVSCVHQDVSTMLQKNRYNVNYVVLIHFPTPLVPLRVHSVYVANLRTLSVKLNVQYVISVPPV
jgi:hypothetical protein